MSPIVESRLPQLRSDRQGRPSSLRCALARLAPVLSRSVRTFALGLALSLLCTGNRAAAAAPAFDGEAAHRMIGEQCAFGPRVPGTPGHAQCLAWMVGKLEAMGHVPERQTFPVANPMGSGSLTGTNLLVRIQPDLTPRILLGAHWDTRPWADEEDDPEKAAQPVLGANDGASGVAALLHLADLLHKNPPPIGVDLAFFDAEDLGNHGDPTSFALGSQWMAENWIGTLPEGVVVLDMVASPVVAFGREQYATSLYPDWADLPFAIAEKLGFTEWDRSVEYSIFDDHTPFLAKGIPATVIIGFGDPTWHTLADRPERTSAETLGKVGQIAVELIYGGYLVAR